MRSIHNRVSSLENKMYPDKLGIMFFDSIALAEDALRHNLPLNVTISEVLEVRPGVEVIHFDELGGLQTYDELKEQEAMNER